MKKSLQEIAEVFLEPQQMKEYIGKYISVAFTDSEGKEYGKLENVDEKEFALTYRGTYAPFYLDTVSYFFEGDEAEFEERNGFELPTHAAVQFIKKEHSFRTPSRMLYRMLYREKFDPVVIDGTLFDKSLISSIYNIGFAHYQRFLRDKMEGSRDEDIEDDLMDIAFTMALLSGKSESASTKVADEALKKYLEYGN